VKRSLRVSRSFASISLSFFWSLSDSSETFMAFLPLNWAREKARRGNLSPYGP
jgi:hypothetical protein